MFTKFRILFALLSIALLIAIIAACVPVPDHSTLLADTQAAMDLAVMQTITARASQQSGSGGDLATVYANATVLSGQATDQAATDEVAYQATATAIVPVLEELPKYGVSPLVGMVGWLQKPLTIDLNGYMQSGYANDFPEITASDFVLAADITWNTQAGSSACGYFFRSDGNKDAPNQFMVYMTRFANGMLFFSAMVDGNITNMQYYFPRPKDKAFQWLNDTTNRLVVVARGKLIDVYTNGVLVAEVDIAKPPPSTFALPAYPQLPIDPSALQLQDYQQQVDQYSTTVNQIEANLVEAQQNYFNNKLATFTDGFLGYMGVSEYGHTMCTFSNAWLYLINVTPTPTPNRTWTVTPTRTPTRTVRDLNTPTRTTTGGPRPINSPTRTRTPTPTPTGILLPSDTPTPTDTLEILTETPTPTDIPTETPTPTDNPTPTDTDTPVPPDTPTETPPGG